VDDPGDAGPRGSDDRQTVTVVSQDDHAVGQGIAAGLEHLFEHPGDFGAPPAESAPNRGELRRRVVANSAVGSEDASGRIQKRLQVGETPGAVEKQRGRRAGERAADGLRRSRRRENRAEVFRRRSASGVLERGQGRRDVLEPGQGEASFARAELAEVGDLFEATADG
jgi:hypothetical protein